MARQLGTTVAAMDRTVSAAELINWAALWVLEAQEEAEQIKAMTGS